MSVIESLTRIGDGAYRVVVQLARGNRSFTFRVERYDGIDVVTWDADFRELMGPDVGRAKLLLAAVLAFHQSQTMSWPA